MENINSNLVDQELGRQFSVANELLNEKIPTEVREKLTKLLDNKNHTHVALLDKSIEYKRGLIKLFGETFAKIEANDLGKGEKPKTNNVESTNDFFDSLYTNANSEVQGPTKEELEKDPSKKEGGINFLVKTFGKEKVKSAFEKGIISISKDGWLIFGGRKIGPNVAYDTQEQKDRCNPENMIKFFKDFANHFGLKFHEPKYTTNQIDKTIDEFVKDNNDFYNNNDSCKYNNPNDSLFKMIGKLINRPYTWIPVFACSYGVIGCNFRHDDNCIVDYYGGTSGNCASS